MNESNPPKNRGNESDHARFVQPVLAPATICPGPLLSGPWDRRHSVVTPGALECGGKRSATLLWLARRGVPARQRAVAAALCPPSVAWLLRRTGRRTPELLRVAY